MNAGTLAAEVMVPFAGAMLCLAPAATRPGVPSADGGPRYQLADRSADPAALTRRYRRFLAACTGAVLLLAALVDLSLLLAALRNWQVYRLSGVGSALPVLPFALALLILAITTLRAGQGGFRLPGGSAAHGPAAGTDRDDDRFWKAGLIYLNRDDPAILVGARFGIGWTFNVANPTAWLIIAAIVAAPAGLAAIAALAGR